jgi:hypothetical protein
MTVAMQSDLPLRSSSAWGAFGEVAIIPHRYGRIRGSALRYDNTGRRYVWADHASQRITEVYVGGQKTSAWSWKNTTDTTGHAITLIELTEATTETVEAAGFGKTDAVTGVLLTNPGLIIADIMHNIAGRPAPDTTWLTFEASKLGIVCAGQIDDVITLQSAIGSVCDSIGALYSPRAKPFARMYPGGVFDGGSASNESGVTVDLDRIESSESRIDEVVNAIIMQFDFRDDKPGQTIEIDCPDSIQRFGRREQTIDARWIADARVANTIANRLLTWRSEPAWVYNATDVPNDISPLQVVHFSGSTKLPTPTSAVVLASNFDPMDDESEITFERLTATSSAIRIVQQSSAIEDRQLTRATVQTVGDNRRIKLPGDDGKPLANVNVLLDGTITRKSDAGGFVEFPVHATPPGIHTLAITNSNGTVTTIQLLIQ